MAKRYALVIGSNNYQNFPPLKKAEADALAVEKLLSDHVLGEFDSIISLTQNVTNKETSIAIKRFFTDPNIEKDDFLLLFFAGHGHRDIIADKLYFAFEDSDEDFLEATALDCYHLRNWMRYSASKKQLVLLDCCYGGHFLESRDSSVKPLQADFIDQNARGRFVITSSAKNQKAYERIEGDANQENSPFTYAFMNGLQTGKVKNNAGTISVRSIYNYINNYVTGLNTSQEPKLFGPEGDEDLILKSVTEKILPEGLYKKLFSSDPDVRLGSVIRLRRLINDDINYSNAAYKTLIEMESKERDRHVYLELTDLQRFLSSQKESVLDIENSIELESNKLSAPTIITNSKTRLHGDVFQDTLKDGSLGPRMVVIPAGEFLMGSPEDEVGRYDNEGPQHLVTLKSFALGQTVVTFDEYDLFCRLTGRKMVDDSGWGRGTRPIIHVTWDDAQDYVQWMSEQTGKSYKLPSEAQWEYACRAGTSSPCYTGEFINADMCNFNGKASFSNHQYNSVYKRKTMPVKTYSPNSFGLYEMLGNVLEWCEDVYHLSYLGAPSDGTSWAPSQKHESHVLRGGTWNSGAQDMRSAFRNAGWPDLCANFVGFRLSRAL